ncbi:hypothetical protein [Streptomyces rectiverticillatus]|uniref:hypothetical protein n=1 Tax=Streptomyces rectiverticillatus TaxID=173860 RepID=UPI001FEA154B|nr:hypothetical protein [Streptomyces rectiverticillatus]
MSQLASRAAAAAAISLAALGGGAVPASAATQPPVVFGAVQYDSPGKETRSNASLNAE